jgi:hypothetical protein
VGRAGDQAKLGHREVRTQLTVSSLENILCAGRCPSESNHARTLTSTRQAQPHPGSQSGTRVTQRRYLLLASQHWAQGQNLCSLAQNWHLFLVVLFKNLPTVPHTLLSGHTATTTEAREVAPHCPCLGVQPQSLCLTFPDWHAKDPCGASGHLAFSRGPEAPPWRCAWALLLLLSLHDIGLCGPGAHLPEFPPEPILLTPTKAKVSPSPHRGTSQFQAENQGLKAIPHLCGRAAEVSPGLLGTPEASTLRMLCSLRQFWAHALQIAPRTVPGSVGAFRTQSPKVGRGGEGQEGRGERSSPVPSADRHFPECPPMGSIAPAPASSGHGCCQAAAQVPHPPLLPTAVCFRG